jgi:hypothetical protein
MPLMISIIPAPIFLSETFTMGYDAALFSGTDRLIRCFHDTDHEPYLGNTMKHIYVYKANLHWPTKYQRLPFPLWGYT